MPHKDQFTATGPAFEDAGFSRAAFSTGRDGTDSTYGVNVQGSECGVYGECVNIGPATDRRAPKEGTGVCGVGQGYGVYGNGFSEAGVYGETTETGAGVFGLASIGVAGMSEVKDHNSKDTAGGMGVVGATEAGRGFGVVGLSVGSLLPPGTATLPFGPTTAPRATQDEKGKVTFGEFGGSGIGVFGGSGIGTGVKGTSQLGNGGEFTSEKGSGALGEGVIGFKGIGTSVGVVCLGAIDPATGAMRKDTVGVSGEGERGGVFRSSLAQIKLVPIDKFRTPVGNISGQAGDLVATQAGPDDCGLWFCVRGGGIGTAMWKQIA